MIDWLSFRQTTQSGGIPVNTFDYFEDGVYQPYSTFVSSGNMARGAGAINVGIQSNPPNIFINGNQSLGTIMNISSNGGGNFSNSFASGGIQCVPSAWSISIIQPLDGTSINLGTGANAPTSLLAPFAWDTGSTTGLFIFQVNATSVDGLTTNQLFIWNVYNQ